MYEENEGNSKLGIQIISVLIKNYILFNIFIFIKIYFDLNK